MNEHKEYTELIHDYFADELTDSQCRQLEDWLEEDHRHVNQLVREAFIHRQITDAIASQKALGIPMSGLPLLDENENAFEKPLGRSLVPYTLFTLGGFLPKLGVLLGVVLLVTTAVFLTINRGTDGDVNPISPQVTRSVTPYSQPQTLQVVRDKPALKNAISNSVASIEPLESCTWQSEQGQQPLIDTRVDAGQTLNLLEGKARVSFDCGAVLTLTGPAVLQVNTDMDATLIGGNLSAVVSQEAVGFLLHTTEMDVRDLGTEFTVRVDPKTGTVVEVVDGEVEAELSKEPGALKEVVSLTEGQYLRAGNEQPDDPERLTIFRGARIEFDKPDCLDLFKIQNPDFDHIRLDHESGKLMLDTTWGSIYARDKVGKNLFLLPVSSSADFDVVLTVNHFEPIPISDHVGVVCMTDKDNYARIIYGAGCRQRYIKFIVEDNGTPLKEIEKPVEFRDQPFKLRLTRRGEEISAWWSNDNGKHWFFRDKGKTPPNAGYVGFYVSKGHTIPNDPTKYREACIESFEFECSE